LPRDPVVRAVLIIFVTLAILVVGAFSYFYVKYDRVIVKRFSSPVFSNSAHIYAIPKVVRPGQTLQAHTIAARLDRDELPWCLSARKKTCARQIKKGRAPEAALQASTASMARLNRDAAEALLEADSLAGAIHAATDVTLSGRALRAAEW